MSLVSRLNKARQLFESAVEHQRRGDLASAIQLYLQSIEAYPTAEAHTYLGWTYSFQGKLEEAITECKKAIVLDPNYGNPYNDIGSYLITQGKYEEAIPWLERALGSRRYEEYQYPWFNLGRAYVAMEQYRRATDCFAKSLEIEPGYTPAAEELRRIKRMLQ